MKTLILATILCTSTSAFAKKQTDCLEVRAAFDVGSSATKLKVAEVDKCTQKIVKVLAEKSIPVAYNKESIKASKTFDPATMEEGLKALDDLKKEAEKFKPKVFAGVATSAFRDSTNGAEFAKTITEKLSIKTKVLPQADEATLGFIGAMGTTKVEADKMVAWDIGSSSTQMTAYDREKGFSTYRGQMASIPFKNAMIKAKNLDPKNVKSPNPILPENIDKLKPLIDEEAAMVDPSIKAKINDGATVVGIGGVHFGTVQGLLRKSEYTQEDLQKLIEERSCMTDEQIGGKYFDSEVTNLILVLKFMQDLNIKKVQAANVNMTDGLLVNPDF